MKNTNLISDLRIIEAKNKSIVGFLQSINIEPVKFYGSELVYFSPFRNEKTPSFHVNRFKNYFNDLGGTEEMKGDIIRLVQVLYKYGFKEAVSLLLNSNFIDTYSFFLSQQINFDQLDSHIKISKIQALQNPALVRYVIDRGILLSHAKYYLREIHYEIRSKKYYALGFKNDNQGFDLRNGIGFKGKTKNGISTINKGTTSINLFEGFFDFLSALSYYNKQEPAITTIILNSTNNLKMAIPYLYKEATIHCFLDNDQAGKYVVEKLRNLGYTTCNYAEIIYPDHKDFNEYLVQRTRLNA